MSGNALISFLNIAPPLSRYHQEEIGDCYADVENSAKQMTRKLALSMSLVRYGGNAGKSDARYGVG